MPGDVSLGRTCGGEVIDMQQDARRLASTIRAGPR
jgi:hypothetical protein